MNKHKKIITITDFFFLNIAVLLLEKSYLRYFKKFYTIVICSQVMNDKLLDIFDIKALLKGGASGISMGDYNEP